MVKRRNIPPVSFENASIIFRNFEGRDSKYNRAGDRNFAVVIEDQEMAQRLLDDGWNVRIREPREEGDRPLTTISVAVRFESFPNVPPAKIFVYTNHNRVEMTEENVSELDFAEIQNVDLTIRPRFWEDDAGETHIKAYLKEMHVTLVDSPWESKYSEYEQ